MSADFVLNFDSNGFLVGQPSNNDKLDDAQLILQNSLICEKSAETCSSSSDESLTENAESERDRIFSLLHYSQDTAALLRNQECKHRCAQKNCQTLLANKSDKCESDNMNDNIDGVRQQCCSNYSILLWMCLLTGGYAIVQLLVGVYSEALTLVSDSLHMISDSVGLAIALVAMHLSKKTANRHQTFGWWRCNVVGSLMNGTYLASVATFSILETLHRLIWPEKMDQPILVLIVGAVGLLINIVGVCMFFRHRNLVVMSGHSHSHSHHEPNFGDSSDSENESSVNNDGSSASRETNLNMHGVFLHVLSDMFGSFLVIISALAMIIWDDSSNQKELSNKWILYVDPVCSLFIAFLILKMAVPLIKQSALILLQSAPSNVDMKTLEEKLSSIQGVGGVHDLHVWQLTNELYVGSVHLYIAKSSSTVTKIKNAVAREASSIFCNAGVHKSTVQIEHAN